MNNPHSKWLLICGLVGLAWGGQAAAVEPLSPERFAEVRALVRPDAAEEKWAEIPWLSSLWEARQQAAAQGKPILLWEMDGHPLGCT